MDRERIEEVFSPLGRVTVKRMFGGHGIYADGLFFALESGGDIYLKCDPTTQPQFEEAGSVPFVYQKRNARPVVMSFWRLVEAAYDDEDALRNWAFLALDAARRAQVAKPARAVSRRRRARN